jgi:hypothetical protein
MVQVAKIAGGEVGIGEVEGDRRFRLRIGAHVPGHVGVGGFVGMDTFRGMEVQRRPQALFVQPTNKAFRVREELAVPRVASPARRGVSRIGNVPVHVDNADGNRHLLPPELQHQGRQLLLAVGPVTAPPVAKRPTRDHGDAPGDKQIVVERLLVAGARAARVGVGKEVEVQSSVFEARFQPALVVEEQRMGIVDDSPAIAGKQARFERGGAADGVEGARRALEVGVIFIAVAPGNATGREPNLQAVAAKRRPFPVVELQGTGLQGEPLLVFFD